jgi:hypothetical protein
MAKEKMMQTISFFQVWKCLKKPIPSDRVTFLSMVHTITSWFVF